MDNRAFAIVLLVVLGFCGGTLATHYSITQDCITLGAFRWGWDVYSCALKPSEAETPLGPSHAPGSYSQTPPEYLTF